MAARGGSRPNAGRKRMHMDRAVYVKNWKKSHKVIYFKTSTHIAWQDAKYVAGYGKSSDDDFAAHLLSLEYRRREEESEYSNVAKLAEISMEIEENISFSGPSLILTSTPVKSSAVECANDDHDDNTIKCSTDSSVTHMDRSNLNISLFTDDEEESDSDPVGGTDNQSYERLFHSAIHDLNGELHETDSDKSTSDSEYSLQDEENEFEVIETDDQHDEVNDADDEQPDEQTEHISQPDKPVFGPHRKLSRGEEEQKYYNEIEDVREKKFICSLGLFLDLFAKCCRTPGCSNVPQVMHHFVGTTVVVTTLCKAGHIFKFASSREVNGCYVNNLQTSAAIVLSGNNYLKINRMAQFLGLPFVSESTFHRYQRLYICPVIEEWWVWMKSELVKEFIGDKIVVGGDGQCDSPGFSAKNLCYFLMELTTGYILEIEVRDKRHVGLASVNMEKAALQNALTRLQRVLEVVEIATDASSSIKKMMETDFKEVFHSLDIWHKAKSIKKCLGKLGKAKSMRKISIWSTHIIRHFWYCASVCKGDNTSDDEALKTMKDKWIGLLHHVCNCHEWLGGKCDHEEDTHDAGVEWFDRRDNDFQELQKVILNAELLESFKYFVRFRHTGQIECLNSLTLAYTPKRTALSYRSYKIRKYLAAIDWNYHLNLPPATNHSGEEIVSRKYNQRTQQWDVRKVKKAKGFEYIPLLIAKILQEKNLDSELVTRNVTLNESDPRLVAPTIAAKPPPTSKELIKRQSRFSLPEKKE